MVFRQIFLFFLLNFAMLVFPAEQSDREVVISMNLSHEHEKSVLSCLSKKKLKFFQKINPNVQENDFCVLPMPSFKYKNAEVFKKSGLDRQIAQLPLAIICTPGLQSFKSKGEELFRIKKSVAGIEYTFIVQFNAEPVISPQLLINNSRRIFNINTSCGVLTRHSLVYCDEEYINYCNQNGIECSYNEPFLAITYDSGDLGKIYLDGKNISQEENQNELSIEDLLFNFQKITYLPYALFFNDGKLKKLNTELFKYTGKIKGIHYILTAILDSDIANSPGANVESFRCAPQYMPGGKIQGNMLHGYLAHKILNLDFDSVEQELIENEILAKIGEQTVHGPNGYFGRSEYNKTVWGYKKKIFFSYIKKSTLGFSFLFSCYLLWTICKYFR